MMTPYKIPPTMRHEDDGTNNIKEVDQIQTYILVCNICGQSHDTHECPFLHDLHYIKDMPKLSRARQSLPTDLELIPMADSTISVIAKRDFQRGTTFGPFDAKRNWAMNPLTSFPIKIFKNNCNEISYLDYTDEDNSNWMCFIPPASNAKEQNLICYQMKEDIFYTAMRSINAGEQLRVWYAPYYAIKMKMPLYNNETVNDDTVYSNEIESQINMNNPSVKLMNTRETSELAERVSAERLGAKNIREYWQCRICTAKIKTVIAYAKHLMEHYKPLLGAFCNICHKKFQNMSQLSKHKMVKHTELNSETIGIPTSENQQQQNAQTILLNMNDSEAQTSDAMKDILEKFKQGNTITEGNIAICEKENHADLSLLDTNTINVNDLLQNNGNLIENSSLKSILENQCLNMNLNSMADSILSENISAVDTVKFNVEELTSELLDITRDVDNLNQLMDDLDCDICGKKFIKTNYLYRHLRKHTGEFICSICLAVFARKENLIFHMCINQKDNIDFECPYCQKTFAMKKYLKRHMLQHLNFNSCKWCRHVFSSQIELDAHKCQAPKYICEQCGKRFVNRAHLSRHVKLHVDPKPKIIKVKKKIIDDKPAICEKCGDVFKTPYSLKQHLKSHGERTYECDICHRRFHRIGVLKEHKQIHQIAQIPCNICGKKLKSKKALDVHVLLHGNKKFQCEKCDKSFFQRCNYLKHYKHIHSEKIIYKCSHCPAQFTSESNYNKHIDSHIKPAQYSCTSCSKSFHGQYQLKRHVQTSHSGLVFRCPYCGMTAKHRHSIRRHFERRHKNSSKEWNKPGFVNQLIEKITSSVNTQKSTDEFHKNDVEENNQQVNQSITHINESLTNTQQQSLNNEEILLQVSNVEQTMENNQLPLTEVPQLSISDTDTQLAESVLNNAYIFDEEGGDIMFYVLDNTPVNF